MQTCIHAAREKIFASSADRLFFGSVCLRIRKRSLRPAIEKHRLSVGLEPKKSPHLRRPCHIAQSRKIKIDGTCCGSNPKGRLRREKQKSFDRSDRVLPGEPFRREQASRRKMPTRLFLFIFSKLSKNSFARPPNLSHLMIS